MACANINVYLCVNFSQLTTKLYPCRWKMNFAGRRIHKRQGKPHGRSRIDNLETLATLSSYKAKTNTTNKKKKKKNPAIYVTQHRILKGWAYYNRITCHSWKNNAATIKNYFIFIFICLFQMSLILKDQVANKV